MTRKQYKFLQKHSDRLNHYIAMSEFASKFGWNFDDDKISNRIKAEHTALKILKLAEEIWT